MVQTKDNVRKIEIQTSILEAPIPLCNDNVWGKIITCIKPNEINFLCLKTDHSDCVVKNILWFYEISQHRS